MRRDIPVTDLQTYILQVKRRKNIGLMTHVVVGYPSLDESVSLIQTMAENGADLIELQIPFSDPLADGPTIMQACETSLRNGTKVSDAFFVMSSLSKKLSVPLLFMGYFNTVYVYGVEKFCHDAKKAGAAGLIIPDIPYEEEQREHYYASCRKYDIPAIPIVSPVTTNKRLQMISEIAQGFVYTTARQGTTGSKESLVADIYPYLHRVKEYLSIPLAVGFGISKREHILSLTGHADIAIIGSKLIEIIDKSPSSEREEHIADFLQSLFTE